MKFFFSSSWDNKKSYHTTSTEQPQQPYLPASQPSPSMSTVTASTTGAAFGVTTNQASGITQVQQSEMVVQTQTQQLTSTTSATPATSSALGFVISEPSQVVSTLPTTLMPAVVSTVVPTASISHLTNSAPKLSSRGHDDGSFHGYSGYHHTSKSSMESLHSRDAR